MIKEKPEFLYHYCSIETLFSILKNELIWLSDLTEIILGPNPKISIEELKSKLQLANDKLNINNILFSKTCLSYQFLGK